MPIAIWPTSPWPALISGGGSVGSGRARARRRSAGSSGPVTGLIPPHPHRLEKLPERLVVHALDIGSAGPRPTLDEPLLEAVDRALDEALGSAKRAPEAAQGRSF